MPEADTQQVAIDFACTYNHHFKGGVHWISHGQRVFIVYGCLSCTCDFTIIILTCMQDVTSILHGAVSQALIISDGVFEGKDFAGLLGNTNVHILLLLSSSTLLEEAKQSIKHIRDMHVHIVQPLSYMQAKQQQTVEKVFKTVNDKT